MFWIPLSVHVLLYFLTIEWKVKYTIGFITCGSDCSKYSESTASERYVYLVDCVDPVGDSRVCGCGYGLQCKLNINIV